jgi:hypothetical protein
MDIKLADLFADRLQIAKPGPSRPHSHEWARQADFTSSTQTPVDARASKGAVESLKLTRKLPLLPWRNGGRKMTLQR